MSAIASPRENAYAESFFKTLKQEEVRHRDYESLEEASLSISQFLDHYNQNRLHSSLGYQPPDKFEAEYNKRQEP